MFIIETISATTASTKSTNSNNVLNNIMESFLEASMTDCDIPLPANLVTDSVELLNYIKLVFHEKSCSYEKKFKIISTLPKNWSYRVIKKHFVVSNEMIRKSKEVVKEKGILSSPIINRGT